MTTRTPTRKGRRPYADESAAFSDVPAEHRDTTWQDVRIRTDEAGRILACTPGALDLLGYSWRGVRGRELANMFITQRPRLGDLLEAARGGVIDREAQFRPNDRKAMHVRYRVTAGETDPDGHQTLLWTFQVRWLVGMRLPPGVDRRQLITIWRTPPLSCVFAPGGLNKRRLFVCNEAGEVLHEEPVPAVDIAFARAGELRKLAEAGRLQPAK